MCDLLYQLIDMISVLFSSVSIRICLHHGNNRAEQGNQSQRIDLIKGSELPCIYPILILRWGVVVMWDSFFFLFHHLGLSPDASGNAV